MRDLSSLRGKKLEDGIHDLLKEIIGYQRIISIKEYGDQFSVRTRFWFSIMNEDKRVIARMPLWCGFTFSYSSKKFVIVDSSFSMVFDKNSLIFDYFNDSDSPNYVIYLKEDQDKDNQALEKELTEMFGSDFIKLLSGLRSYNALAEKGFKVGSAVAIQDSASEAVTIKG